VVVVARVVRPPGRMPEWVLTGIMERCVWSRRVSKGIMALGYTAMLAYPRLLYLFQKNSMPED